MRRYVAIVLSSVLVLQAAPLFMASSASAAPAVRVGGGQTQATSGTVEGTARNADGKVLPRQGVQLRNLDTGQVIATSSSNGQGGFSFARVPPANYVVEIIDSKTGAIVGTSAAMAVSAGTTAATTVAATTAMVQGAAAAAGAGSAAAGGAAAGGAAGGAAAGGAAAAGAAAAAGGMGIGISTALVVATVAVAAGVAGVVVVSRDNPSPSN